MMQEHHITFGPFRFEVAAARLWRGTQAIPLRPRTGAVLQYLATHPGRLITKTELLQHVWGGMHVTDTVLRVCIRELRTALDDTVDAPQYLQTVGRQGYQWLGAEDRSPVPLAAARPIVGRQAEVELLERQFARAVTGVRQLVFLSGEAGIGKTTIIDQWLTHLVGGRPVWLGRGQCAEHYGDGEPYLPVLDALRHLSRGPAGPALLAVLRHCAPMWLVQLPGLVSDTEVERVQRQVQGATQARMIRELAEALDILTTDTPLVLVLEDLHWSDSATVECLVALAQRREPAQFLVLGTYRPVETVVQAHPLRGTVQELCGRGQALDLRVEFLSSADVAAYVAGRLGGSIDAALTACIYEHTSGNALFMVNLVDYLVAQGELVRHTGTWRLREGAETPAVRIPEEVRQLLLRRIEALLPATRRVLESASVVGREFAVAAVAAGLHWPVAEVEAACEAFATQHHLLDDIGIAVWPDGTRGGRYRFQHALYQQTLYEQIGTARRMELHRSIGLRLEVGYGASEREIAAQLARHFEYGGETLLAVAYWQQTGENAARRNAYHEAIAALRKGLALLATLPDSPERAQRELALQILLGELFVGTRSMASPEAGEAFSRAHVLCQGLGTTLQHFQVLQGLCSVQRAQARLHAAEALSQQAFEVAQDLQNAALMRESHLAMGSVAFYRGDLAAARVHLEHSLILYDTPPLLASRSLNGYEPGVRHGSYFALVLWLSGYADQAQQRSQETLTLAQQIGHTPSIAFATIFAALFSQFCRDVVTTQARAHAQITNAPRQGFAYRIDQANLFYGWALAMQGDTATGIALIRQGLAAAKDISFQLYWPYFLTLLAEAYGQAGQPEAGLPMLDDALTRVATTEERWWEAEVWRVKGALLLRLPLPDLSHATACFQQALDVARRQQARALELRAALSLSRLWQQPGQRSAAYELLRNVYRQFTEGWETADLQEARQCLADLERERVSPTSGIVPLLGRTSRQSDYGGQTA